jgi:hypothetical protein
MCKKERRTKKVKLLYLFHPESAVHAVGLS